jgi:hypothetical protein
MHDMDGPEIAGAIYQELFGRESEQLDSSDIPYALDAAVQRLRARGAHFTRWAPYIHIGL